VASIQAHRVVESVLARLSPFVTRVGYPAVGLEEDGGAEVFLTVPPVRRAGGTATGAEDAFVETVELLAVSYGLAVLTSIWRWGVALEVWLDGAVLLVELGHIGNEIFDYIGVW